MPRLTWCPESRYVYWHTDGTGLVRVHPFPCKSWECPYCGREKHHTLRETLSLAFRRQVEQFHAAPSVSPSDVSEGDHWPCHVILTIDPEHISRTEAWAGLGKRFDRFRRGLQRDGGNKPPVYARTVAQHETSGYPHVHLLVFLPPKYGEFSEKELLQRLRYLWGPHDGGGRAKLGRKIDSQPAMRTVVDYIVRQLPEPLPHLPKRARRVSVSQNLSSLYQEDSPSKAPKRDKAGGDRRRGNIRHATETLRAKGFRVTATPFGIVAEPPRA